MIVCAEASAVHLKNVIVDFLSREGYEFTDAASRDDFSYIETGSIIGESVSGGDCPFGIVMCGSGMRGNLAASRFRASAAACENPSIPQKWPVLLQTVTYWPWEEILRPMIWPAAW